MGVTTFVHIALCHMFVQGKKAGKKKITVKWKKDKKVSGYEIQYATNKAFTKNLKKVTVKGAKKTSKTIKKLKKGKSYKFLIIAEKGDKTIAISKTMHVMTKGHKKNDNFKSVTVKKSVVNKAKKLKKNKSLSLKATGVKPAGKKVSQYVKMRYETSNPKVATVSKKGKVKAVGKGTCTIYAYAQNGIYKSIKVKVK